MISPFQFQEMIVVHQDAKFLDEIDGKQKEELKALLYFKHLLHLHALSTQCINILCKKVVDVNFDVSLANPELQGDVKETGQIEGSKLPMTQLFAIQTVASGKK
ncbi:hypothetical protein QVD17_19252 [Tagetes erecta]|uniref:Uncharacterized protein n=1 Tax=Tagetes erecta TaxID=13708 RepID=A0AAD8KMP3_TARER|nr:hypothetical protein QVD17_19252 [Tagetes erecta]